jgi:hypothetical protein
MKKVEPILEIRTRALSIMRDNPKWGSDSHVEAIVQATLEKLIQMGYTVPETLKDENKKEYI